MVFVFFVFWDLGKSLGLFIVLFFVFSKRAPGCLLFSFFVFWCLGKASGFLFVCFLVLGERGPGFLFFVFGVWKKGPGFLLFFEFGKTAPDFLFLFFWRRARMFTLSWATRLICTAGLDVSIKTDCNVLSYSPRRRIRM